MSDLDDVVSLTITSDAVTPSRQGFGVPLVVAFMDTRAPIALEARSVKDLPDGISPHSSVSRALAKVFSQNPRPDKSWVVLYPADRTALAQTVKLTPLSASDATSYTFTLDASESVEVDVPVDGSLADEEEKIADVCAKIAAALNGKAGIVATVEGGVSVKLVKAATNTGARFNLRDLPPLTVLRVQDNSANLPVTEALDWAEENIEGTDWYGLLLADKPGDAIAKGAEWTEQRRKLFVATPDADRYLTIATSLKDSGYDRMATLHCENELYSFSDAAWLSQNLPVTPGASTWTYSSLKGVKADKINPTKKGQILSANGNLYTRLAGLDVTREGNVASAEWIDVIHFIDWLHSRIQERVFEKKAAMAAAKKKIPFTDSGAETFRAIILAVLAEGVRNGGLAADPAPTVTIPKVVDVPLADRKNRTLPDISFAATLAGAINKTKINGVVSA